MVICGGPGGVKLPGHEGKLAWEQEPDGLKITLPKGRPCKHAFVFKREASLERMRDRVSEIFFAQGKGGGACRPLELTFRFG